VYSYLTVYLLTCVRKCDLKSKGPKRDPCEHHNKIHVGNMLEIEINIAVEINACTTEYTVSGKNAPPQKKCCIYAQYIAQSSNTQHYLALI